MNQPKTFSVSKGVLGLSLLALIIAAATTALAVPGNRHKHTCSTWQDDFSGTQLDLSLWVIPSGQAPGYIPGQHIGYYQPDHVSVGGGFLSMLLTQEIGSVDTNPAGVVSRGALIYTQMKCGYGTYEWTMRMSSTAGSPAEPGYPASGSVSAGFIYVNNSQTEIDFEFSGQNSDTVYAVNWLNPTPSSDPTPADETFTAVSPFDSTSAFHTYRFVWEPGMISFFIDGILQAQHTTNVPTAPAYFMINHWGSDSPNWGGPATLGTARYFYVDRVSYTPLQ